MKAALQIPSHHWARRFMFTLVAFLIQRHKKEIDY
jgi:hypothetical protein